jgi:hypothetical protein
MSDRLASTPAVLRFGDIEVDVRAGALRRNGQPITLPNQPLHNRSVIPGSLPAADWVREGLHDLSRGVESVHALLVSVGAPRLQRLGIRVPNAFDTPEHRLYQRLAAENPDAAHSRYNALIRRLVSFEHAAACVS